MKFWEDELTKARKICKIRITHMEKTGNGITAMQEKSRLRRLERIIKLRKQNGK